MTYGPFEPGRSEQPFPPAERVREDFDLMCAAGINAIRTYNVPTERVLEAAEEYGLAVLSDIPWSKHICFLESSEAQADARRMVRRAVALGRNFRCVFAYALANEIPPNILRWHGTARVERFLRDLMDVAKQADPAALVTYANYPPAEFLDLSFLDFATFNVYLHDRTVFRRYLQRLQNLIGDKPLILGELGMDSIRNGELTQADFLAGHLQEVALAGLAGAFVFSWTDDWHTGGAQVDDWSFGITDRCRFPKAALHAVREVFTTSPQSLLEAAPKVSVVVCSHNGGRTLQQCLQSLLELNYPDYEVIVVDDGSTDDTPEILTQFPSVRIIRQSNRGLSIARNVGLYAADGSIVAYTDSDCFADRDWLTHLVHQLAMTKADAVGGPNLTPNDGWLASCIAACPGQPMHVLENDQVAEHIPGCNMAFRRDALLAINGFQEQYRKAGDDVDVCWRLQQAGYWITFAPGAFVWHHRRCTVRGYLRQQSGYGAAEAMLRFQHPDRFNRRGDGKWNGVLYGASLGGLRIDRPMIYHGRFGAALFQCLYQPRDAHWAMLPATLEWHVVIALSCLTIPEWPRAAMLPAFMWSLSCLVAALQASQAKLSADYRGLRSRILIAVLCYLQPLVRAWHRQLTRLFSRHRHVGAVPIAGSLPKRVPFRRPHTETFWTEKGVDRMHLLDKIVACVDEHGWSKVVDTGWESWDLELFCDTWSVVRVATVDENHGGQKRLIRVRYGVRPSGYLQALAAALIVIAAEGLLFRSWPLAAGAALLLLIALGVLIRGSVRATRAIALVNWVATDLGLVSCVQRFVCRTRNARTEAKIQEAAT